jgi:hypothetical protein
MPPMRTRSGGRSEWLLAACKFHALISPCRATFPVPEFIHVCKGVSDPPTQVKTPCRKCIDIEAQKIKDSNVQANNDKMHQRTGAGNDNFMKSLSDGPNHDEFGTLICNKPEGFVNLTMLGTKHWNELVHFIRVGKMVDEVGTIVDRPDITPEQKALQILCQIAIAQRNSSLQVWEIGSLNKAYAGMSSREIEEPLHSASSADTAFSSLWSDDDVFDLDTPDTPFFPDDVQKAGMEQVAASDGGATTTIA